MSKVIEKYLSLAYKEYPKENIGNMWKENKWES